MVFISAFLANETPMIRAVTFSLNIRMIFTINLIRVFISNQIFNLFVYYKHQLLICVKIAVVLLAASSTFKISLFCDIFLTILWRLDHLFFGTLSTCSSNTTHHDYRFTDSEVKSFLAFETFQ
jgi:hypothetical protein